MAAGTELVDAGTDWGQPYDIGDWKAQFGFQQSILKPKMGPCT